MALHRLRLFTLTVVLFIVDLVVYFVTLLLNFARTMDVFSGLLFQTRDRKTDLGTSPTDLHSTFGD